MIVRKRRIPVLLLLINRGADINARDGDGKAALHLASSKDYLEIVLLLFDRGVYDQHESSCPSNYNKLFFF